MRESQDGIVVLGRFLGVLGQSLVSQHKLPHLKTKGGKKPELCGGRTVQWALFICGL